MKTRKTSRATGRSHSRLLAVSVSLVLGAAMPVSGLAQSGKAPGLWQFGASESAPVAEVMTERRINVFGTFMLDRAQLAQALDGAAASTMRGAAPAARALEVPTPDGDMVRLQVWEDSFLSPELQAKHPDVRIFSGRGLDDPSITAVIDITPSGLRAQIIGNEGTLLIDPVEPGGETYLSFWKHDAEPSGEFKCSVEDAAGKSDPLHAVRTLAMAGITPFANPSGTQRTTYRMRIVTTSEYTNFWSGRDPARDAAITTMNRVRGIYEREVAISFNLVSIDNLLSGDDGYPFTGATINGTRLNENNDWLNDTYGLDSYDIGHVFSAASGGGLAARPSVCRDNKGRGGTALNNPSGDVFDVDYVAHEVGHQMGGRHTFAGAGGNCDDANRATEAAYEPGSGTTIMAYAGICGAANVQANSNDYFHTRSFDEITETRDTSGCGAVAGTGNTPPNVNAGANYTIPQNTPFRLTATGSDPADGDPVTFNWEQYDLAVAPYTATPQANSTAGPLFRSRPSTASPTRVLPRFEDILSEASTPFEVLPTVNRAMNFRVTARDNQGGVRYDAMQVNVSGGEFRVTQPAQGSNQECGLPTDLEWSVGGGNVAPNVRALYSTDNGANFSTLIGSTDNDGAEQVTLPKTLTNNNSRVMLEGIGNIFFSVSKRFSVRDTLAPEVTAPSTVKAECSQKNPPGTPKSEVPLGTAASTDVCAGPLSVSNNAPDVFLLGNNTVTWSSTDPSGNIGTDTQTVTIEDTTKPTISVTLSPTVLWPPNHQMVPITATVTVGDICDPDPAVRLVSITSSEPDNGLGDGNFEPDIQEAAFGTADYRFALRAERSGLNHGRTYTVTYEVEDASGNKAQAEATVLVPHDRK